MKIIQSVLIVFGSLVLAGCGVSNGRVAEANAPTPAATYKDGAGLQLSEGARELAGLQSMDVAERAIGTRGRAAAVPASALIRTVKGDFVYVANGPWFLRTPVTLGATDGEWFQVTDGLYEGDTVVTRGVQMLWLAELQAVNGGVGCADGK